MTEDTYTHRPGAMEDSETQRDADDERDADDLTAPIERGRQEWTRRDWVLVGVIVLCFLVIPATIVALPAVAPYRFAYLALPMLPAVLLGATAVWSAQRSDTD